MIAWKRDLFEVVGDSVAKLDFNALLGEKLGQDRVAGSDIPCILVCIVNVATKLNVPL